MHWVCLHNCSKAKGSLWAQSWCYGGVQPRSQGTKAEQTISVLFRCKFENFTRLVRTHTFFFFPSHISPSSICRISQQVMWHIIVQGYFGKTNSSSGHHSHRMQFTHQVYTKLFILNGFWDSHVKDPISLNIQWEQPSGGISFPR